MLKLIKEDFEILNAKIFAIFDKNGLKVHTSSREKNIKYPMQNNSIPFSW